VSREHPLEAKPLADIAVPDLAGKEGAQPAVAGCRPPAEVGPPAAGRRGPAEALAGCHRPSTRTSAADWTLSIPEACNRRKLVDQNEMSALWITPRSRARGSSATPTLSNVTDWISQVEAVELLGVTPTSVYRMVSRGACTRHGTACGLARPRRGARAGPASCGAGAKQAQAGRTFVQLARRSAIERPVRDHEEGRR
jgi:hypothetical protein